MPVITSTYRAKKIIKNNHIQTVLPNLFRKVESVRFERERLELCDGDFLDLDWAKVGSPDLVILSHGLEGSSYQQYIKGMSLILNKSSMDVLAWNNRSCSGELNRLPGFYHSGSTDDLDAVIDYARGMGIYKTIMLVGFSMGGNQTLKWLGERGSNLPSEISGAVAFSTPCDLASCVEVLSQKKNRLYMLNFMATLKKKVVSKHLKIGLPQINLRQALWATTFYQWDNAVTSPLHGFENAMDYYTKASSLPFIKNIKVPTLLINALDDPFLAKEAYPIDLATKHKHFYFEMPPEGGHVGFMQEASFDESAYWSEVRARNFLIDVLGKSIKEQYLNIQTA